MKLEGGVDWKLTTRVWAHNKLELNNAKRWGSDPVRALAVKEARPAKPWRDQSPERAKGKGRGKAP